jgi:two-component system OmpR family response regulator
VVAKVLIVDDDPAIREVVRFALARDGFATDEAADGAAALGRMAGVDLVVLDMMMPGLDGIACCRELRRTSAVPVLFLSSRGEEVDRIVGLEVGGDDYLGKPFSPRELVARVRAILRRGAAPPAADVLRQGRLTLDPGAVRAAWDGREVALTATEFGILRTLMERAGRVVSRDGLMDGAYAGDRVVSDRTIDSHVRRLRAKFAAVGGAPVETLPGFGYRLGPCG